VIHLDSSFLIDLQRETAGERPGAAFDLIESLDEGEILAVSRPFVCGLGSGAALAKRGLQARKALDERLSGLLVVYPDDRFATIYAGLLAATARGGRQMAAMDLLIATAATLDAAPLVTRDVKGFSRIPGLRLLKY